MCIKEKKCDFSQARQGFSETARPGVNKSESALSATSSSCRTRGFHGDSDRLGYPARLLQGPDPCKQALLKFTALCLAFAASGVQLLAEAPCCRSARHFKPLACTRIVHPCVVCGSDWVLALVLLLVLNVTQLLPHVGHTGISVMSVSHMHQIADLRNHFRALDMVSKHKLKDDIGQGVIISTGPTDARCARSAGVGVGRSTAGRRTLSLRSAVQCRGIVHIPSRVLRACTVAVHDVPHGPAHPGSYKNNCPPLICDLSYDFLRGPGHLPVDSSTATQRLRVHLGLVSCCALVLQCWRGCALENGSAWTRAVFRHGQCSDRGKAWTRAERGHGQCVDKGSAATRAVVKRAPTTAVRGRAQGAHSWPNRPTTVGDGDGRGSRALQFKRPGELGRRRDLKTGLLYTDSVTGTCSKAWLREVQTTQSPSCHSKGSVRWCRICMQQGPAVVPRQRSALCMAARTCMSPGRLLSGGGGRGGK